MTATIEEGLVSYIEANVASVGKGYPLNVPQDAAYPSWAYEVSSDEPELTMEGPTGWHQARMTLMFLAPTYAGGKAAANAVVAALNGYKGAMGGKTVQYCHATASDAWSDMHIMPVAKIDITIDYV